MTDPLTRRSLTERIVSSGVLQAHAPDAAVWIGVLLIGIGVHQLSTPATWIYAGVALIAFAVLSAMSAGAARAKQKRQDG